MPSSTPLTDVINTMPGITPATPNETVRVWLKENVSQWQNISWLEFQIWRHTQGVTSALLQGVVDTGSVIRATAAQHMLDVGQAGQSFSTGDSRIRQLIIDAALPAPMRTSLQQLAQVDVVRWDFGGIDTASELAHIKEARS